MKPCALTPILPRIGDLSTSLLTPVESFRVHQLLHTVFPHVGEALEVYGVRWVLRKVLSGRAPCCSLRFGHDGEEYNVEMDMATFHLGNATSTSLEVST